MNDEVNCLADLGFDVFDPGLLMASHYEIREATQGFRRRIRVDCGQRSRVSGVEGIEQSSCFLSAYFSQDDSVRPPSQGTLQQIVERHASFVGVGLAFGTYNVRLLDIEFGGVFDGYDPLLVGDRVGKNV